MYLVATKLWAGSASLRPDSGSLHIAFLVHWLLAPHWNPVQRHRRSSVHATSGASCSLPFGSAYPELSASANSRVVPEMLRACASAGDAGITLRSCAADALQRVEAARTRLKARIPLFGGVRVHSCAQPRELQQSTVHRRGDFEISCVETPGTR